MKFGQLKEHNIRNICLEKSYPKFGGETFSDPFLENQNSVYLWTDSLKVLNILFLLYAKL